jgi:queuine/archaeosine tRNA-ribosyltransferase
MGLSRPAGPKTLVIAGRTLALPIFFPSVSSVKTNLRPVDYVEVLATVGEPQFLVSAYDIANATAGERVKLTRQLEKATEGSCLLLDSGNYESFWHRDRRWSPASYFRVLKSSPANLAFCFDSQRPMRNLKRGAAAVSREVDAAQAVTDRTSVLPIVHGAPADLPIRVAGVARRSRPLMLAVPERCLGDGILARAATVRAIRRVLDEVQPDCALHLLGTGNPIALAIYAIAGAQSFDGLEWCQTCADPGTAKLVHFQHRELVREMSPEILEGLPYAQATLVHNLLFFREWMTRLRESLERDRHADFLLTYTSPATVRRLGASLRGRS